MSDEFPESVYCCDCGDLIGFADPDCGCDCSEDSEAVEGDKGWQCSDCYKSSEWDAWLEETLDSVASLSAEYEWEFDRDQYSGGFNTKSRYYELHRECDSCILGLDDDCTCESLKLRISDHGSCYCREDVSIARDPSGDDHTIANLAYRLSRPRP